MRDSVNGGPMPMDRSSTDETLREFLDRRERELAEQLRDLRAKMWPKQQEFAEVRRTKAALGMPAVTSTFDEAGSYDDMNYRELARSIQSRSPEDMTIKDLILRALLENFRNGGSPAQIGNFIEAQYKRTIDPGSIRPNLARLRKDGLIIHDNLASRWMLNPSAMGQLFDHFATDEDRALLDRATKLAWTADDDAFCRECDGWRIAGVPEEEIKSRIEQRVEEKLRQP
jgi:hypothetical protein